MPGNHDDAFAVADDHVTRKNRDTAAANGNIEVNRVMDRQIQGSASTRAIHRKVHLPDGFAIAQTAVGYHAGHSSHLEPHEKDISAGRGTRIAPAVHHQHLTRGNGLHRLALRMLGVFEDAQLIQILASGNVSQRKRFADQIAARRAHATHILDKDVAKPALE